MTKTPSNLDDTLFAALCQAADAAIAAGLAYARADDPHRFATLGRQFDGGRAVKRLVLEYLPGGQVRVAMRLDGTSAGDHAAVEVFSTTMQRGDEAPSDGPVH